MEQKPPPSYDAKLLPPPNWLSSSTIRPPPPPPATASAAASAAGAGGVSPTSADPARKWFPPDPSSAANCLSFNVSPPPPWLPSAASSSSSSSSSSSASSSSSSALSMPAPPKPASSPSPSTAAAAAAPPDFLVVVSSPPLSSSISPPLPKPLPPPPTSSTLHRTSDLSAASHHTSRVDLVDTDSIARSHSVVVLDHHHHHHHHHRPAAPPPSSSHHDPQQQQQSIWSSRLKADISMHPLYSQLLAAHVACLRIATPVDQLPRIDAQIAQAAQIISKYEVLGPNSMLIGDEKDELDQFMTHYVLLLCTFKEQLQQHVRVHAMEAVMACWELEQSLLTLTGVSPGEGTGATMSDDDDDLGEGDQLIFDAVIDGHDSGAFGPLIPTETERTLMERVRQELKSELKNGYKDRIVDVREEILRKRRAGKLPGDTTSVLKAWWHAHSKWPYPTEDEKARLVQETGLQLKQINNWFINQRKRNWHSNPSSTAAHKSKRKR